MADKEIFRDFKPNSNEVKKSTFDKSFINNLTARVGRAIPCFVEEAPANSAYTIDTDFAFDLQSLWYPVQNNITAHLSFFRVPMRLLMKNFKRFQTQIGRDGKINGSQQYSMPYIKRPKGWCGQGSLADYMGLPTNHYTTIDRKTRVPGASRSDFRIVTLYRPQDLYFINTLGSTVKAGDDYAHSYGLVFKTDGVKMSDAAKIYISFFTAEEIDGQEVTASYLTSLFTAHSVTFKLVAGKVNADYARNDRDPINGQSVLSQTVDFGVTPHVVKYVATYTLNGMSVKAFSIELSIDTSKIAVYNSTVDYYGGNNYFILHFTDDTANTIPLSFLMSRNSGLPHITLDASKVGIISQKDEGLSDMTIKPASDKFGMTALFIDLQETLNGSAYHFCSISDNDPVIPINALPFRAYEYIHNYFYRNTRVDPFMKYSPETGNVQECYDEYITNDGDGADSTTPVDFFNVPWEYDMFTTCVKEPFYGNAPLVGINYQPVEGLDYSTATFTMNAQGGGTYSFDAKVSSDGKLIGLDYSSAGNSPNKPLFDALNYAINCGISINDFRNASALTRFQEKYMKAGSARYSDIVEEFFGVRPALGEEHPTYLGGVSRRVMVNKIMNTAQSEGNPLGDFAGTASVRGKSQRIKVFCKEPCYIMGILYFSVTPIYSQMLPKHFIKHSLLDYYNPIFANIAPQPVYKKQLAPLQLSVEEVDEVFGYNRPYADYVSRQDEVHGDFRGNMADFLFQRLFKEKPRLNSSFISIHSADLTNIFSSIEDNDKIFGQIAFGVRAKLPIPRYSTPHIL